MIELAVGGFLFWVIVIAFLIACEFSTVNESHWSFAWLIIFLGVLAWGSTFNPFAWMWHNPGTTLMAAALYIVVGVGWGFVKWMFHLHNEKDYIEANLADYKTQYNQALITVHSPFNGTFTDYLESRKLISRAAKNKYLISIWMLWWPFSVLWTALHDVLRRFYNWVIEKYLYLFDKINVSVFGSLNQ